jgi:hypothetical protein
MLSAFACLTARELLIVSFVPLFHGVINRGWRGLWACPTVVLR